MIAKFKDKTPNIGKNVFLASSCDVIGDVSIGDDSSIWYGCVLRGDVNDIKIGSRSNIQDLSVIHVDEPKDDNKNGYSTIIGDNVTIGHNCTIHGCKIEDNTLIGMGSVILNGAVIGKECMVGANSLITSNKVFAPRSLIVGSPAKVLRKLRDDEVAFLHKSANNYVKNKNEFLKNIKIIK